MTDPYDASQTLEPGELAKDDPMDERTYCRNCGKMVETNIAGQCRNCNEEIEG